MSKYKFKVGQLVMHKDKLQSVIARRKIEPVNIFGRSYHVTNNPMRGSVEAGESELTAIQESQ